MIAVSVVKVGKRPGYQLRSGFKGWEGKAGMGKLVGELICMFRNWVLFFSTHPRGIVML